MGDYVNEVGVRRGERPTKFAVVADKVGLRRGGRATAWDAETAVCRLRSMQRAMASPGRPPFLVRAGWENDVAGLRQPIEKKGETKLNTFGRKGAECR